MSRFIQLSLAALVLVALVACSADGGGPGVATLDSPDPSSASGSSPAPSAVSPQDAALAYARCMRENGVDMPDPHVETSANGDVKIDQRGGAPVAKEKMEAADKVCQHFLAAAGANGPAQQMSAEDQDKVLAFAKCMREHGVDMPDPDFTGGGVRMQVGTGTQNNASGGKGGPDDPDFQAAQEACGSLLPGKMGQPGFNSGTDSDGGAESSPVNQ
jgi:hypothetical protein